jgi:hypothetical protein
VVAPALQHPLTSLANLEADTSSRARDSRLPEGFPSTCVSILQEAEYKLGTNIQTEGAGNVSEQNIHQQFSSLLTILTHLSKTIDNG